MKRRYVTTLIIETDENPAGWSLDRFANEVRIGAAHESGDGGLRRKIDRGPKSTCTCPYGVWAAEYRDPHRSIVWGSTPLTTTVWAGDDDRPVFEGEICAKCAGVEEK